ncbi:hydroxypyruvate isomerase [Limnohabitans sp. 2KL-3]|uniref:hydroxypyruvate isomerase n=1 Tax=Limnohabitans sp. 2KL-3 TaxID=1100700 RepID=UPI000AB29074|nr:hydroxypyruvate isomerase [Limnohabitans sp. 2KL-3]
MPRFSANLSMLFTELPFLDRFDRAARAGFEGVEFLFPYDHPAEEVAKALQDSGLKLVLHNLPAGHWASGERGIACHPDRVVEFCEGLNQALDYARVLGTPQINCLAGILPVGVDTDQAQATLVRNLRQAAATLGRKGVRLLMEPINTFDIPGFFVNRTAQALQIMDEVGSDNLYLQYDIYHAQRMEGELSASLHKHLSRIAHVQIADTPGRHEPGTGEINYQHLFNWLDEIGYSGWVGCEYKPRNPQPGGTEAGLGWLPVRQGTPSGAVCSAMT